MIFIYWKTKELQPKTITAHLFFFFLLLLLLLLLLVLLLNHPNYVFLDMVCDVLCGLHG